MILDEVLNKNAIFNQDDMVDIFVEGFLFALEMQEAGYKAGSTEELSKTIIEGADVAISELSADYVDNKIKIAKLSRSYHDAAARNARLTASGIRHGNVLSNKSVDFWENRAKEQDNKADKRRKQIDDMKYYNYDKRIQDRIKNKVNHSK